MRPLRISLKQWRTSDCTSRRAHFQKVQTREMVPMAWMSRKKGWRESFAYAVLFISMLVRSGTCERWRLHGGVVCVITKICFQNQSHILKKGNIANHAEQYIMLLRFLYSLTYTRFIINSIRSKYRVTITDNSIMPA